MSALFPVFIPHMGCPHRCVFCDQHAIAGTAAFDPATAEQELEAMLAERSPGMGGEIAFFGGSFTGIDRALMRRLLSFAKRYVDRGVVDGIRLSTRPDYIDADILAILREYPVKTVELGIQSLSDSVLLACHRGHSAEQSIMACDAVKQAGFSLVGQMMIGLPDSSADDEKATAARLCKIPVDAARIYPTVILPDTPLAAMAKNGEYTPLSLADAVSRSADALEIFQKSNVPVIRIGLCSNETVRKNGIGFHDAIGELVRSEIYRRRMQTELERLPMMPTIAVFSVARGHTSLAVGHKRVCLKALEAHFGIQIRMREDEKALPFFPILTETR